MRGGGDACFFPVAGLEELGNVAAQFAAGDVDEGSSDVAGHFVEEAVAFDFEGGFFKCDVGDGADGVGLGFTCKGGEVVGADQVVFRAEHFGDVEGLMDVPGVEAHGGVVGGAEVEFVMVFFFEGVEGGMKRGRDGFELEGADVGRENGVELVGGDLFFRAELDDLAHGVDAAVGAAGGFGQNGFLRELEDRFLKRFLNGGAAAGFLPPVVLCAVVGEKGFKMHCACLGTLRGHLKTSGWLSRITQVP